MLNNFGKTLRNLRRQNKENITQMADKLNVSLSFLSRLENGYELIDEEFVSNVISRYLLNEKESKNIIEQKNQANLNMKNHTLSQFVLERKINYDDDLIASLRRVLNEEN